MKIADAYKIKGMIASGASTDDIIQSFEGVYEADHVKQFLDLPIKRQQKRTPKKKVTKESDTETPSGS